MDVPRSLVIVADDFGIGPSTSRGILHLARGGKLTAAVLLVNSPHAAEAVRDWRRAGGSECLELGWHACLTMDRPLLPPARVRSLVREDGSFLPLARFAGRLALGRVRFEEVRAELEAQYRRFLELTGQPPALVNGHHHVQVLPGIGPILLDVLDRQRPLPYIRRVRETVPLLAAIPRARCKRLVLATLGGRFGQRQLRRGFPGNDFLAGITDLRGLTEGEGDKEENLLVRWLARVPGKVVEFLCHPGYLDGTLAGRDGEVPSLLTRATGWGRPAALAQARLRELELLERTSLDDVCRAAGFRLTRPSRLAGWDHQGHTRAAA